MNRRFLWLLLLVIPAFFVFRDRFVGNTPDRKPSHRYNLIFITIDTLRADHTPFGGYNRQTMPATADFFRDAINFTGAETPRSTTTPAYSSMFSGLYPYHHGVRDLMLELNPQIETLAEILHREGYVTAGFVSSFAMNGSLSGFNQGFDIYDDYVDEKRPNGIKYERKAGRTIDRAIRWLHNRKNERPFFLFLHLIDPHGPYHPPDPFSKEFHSDQSRLLPPSLIRKYLLLPGEFNLFRYVDSYDGEIKYADSQLKRLYEVLQPLRSNTWIVFLADHGESMSEHDIPIGHGHSCFESETRIPYLWLPPLDLKHTYPAGKIADPVSLVDVAPTVYEILQIRSLNSVDGNSLVPLLKREPFDSRSIYIENYRDEQKILVARNGNLKLISWKSNIPHESLFNVVSDPMEEKDLISSTRPSAKLVEDLKHYYDESESFQPAFTIRPWPENVQRTEKGRTQFIQEHNKNEMTDEDREKLKALGYVD
jgi:arylsulfatase A-like enzyme